MERQHTEWEKIYANDTTDKGLISRKHKQLMQLNIRKSKKPKPKKKKKKKKKQKTKKTKKNKP